MRTSAWVLWAVLSLTASCGGQSAGEGNGGSGGNAAGGSGGTDGGSVDPSLIGTWIGYVESHQFASGSDTVKVEITDGVPNGSAVFGQGVPPPPATNPDLGYPEGWDQNSMSTPYDGFAYTLVGGDVTADRVRFDVSTHELWTVWCTLQVPYQWTPELYGCLPNWGYSWGEQGCAMHNDETGESMPVDCGKLTLCSSMSVCDCTASGCQTKPYGDIAFDLDHAGNELDGSVTLLGAVRNVRLTKQ